MLKANELQQELAERSYFNIDGSGEPFLTGGTERASLAQTSKTQWGGEGELVL